MLTEIFLGVCVGFGLFVIARALIPDRMGAAARVAQIDALRELGRFGAPAPEDAGGMRDRLGRRLAELFARYGWEMRSVRADLYVLQRSWQRLLVTKFGLAVTGFLIGPLLFAAALEVGIRVNPFIPLWVALALAAVFFMLPDLEVRRDADAKRLDLRRIIAAYLDLVAMNLAGGRGLPEALTAAAEISEGDGLGRIRDCLAEARLSGTQQWAALGRLGSDLGIKELTDLGTALALVADDGAKVRASLSARAETMRKRELADLEGKAGARSQSMLVAQMFLCLGFMVFILFPAVMRLAEL
jgi:Flp pilus assembly protein TadB